MKTLIFLPILLLTAACSSDPKKREKFGDNKYHAFTEDSTGERYFIKHRLGDNYSLYTCEQVLGDIACDTQEH